MPKDVANFQIESEHPPEWYDRSDQRMNIVHIMTRLLHHGPGHDRLVENGFGSALRDSNMFISYGEAWDLMNATDDDIMESLLNTFWKNVKTYAISIGY